MRLVLLLLAVILGLSCEASAQCPAPAVVYYGGYAGNVPYGAYYAPYASYLPFSTQRPNYPALSSGIPPTRYGTQSTYFRGAPAGAFAPPGGTFFGGYDYRITYPANWYGGYWGGW